MLNQNQSEIVRPHVEIADIFRMHSAKLDGLTAPQIKVITNITRCRTAALGGHVLSCDNEECSHIEISYNSCRDRHCPKCQSIAKEQWILDRQTELLPVTYFHNVFTIPRLLAPILMQNKKSGYDLLFKAVSQTLKEVAANPKNMGARIGFICILHTWDQTLLFHPHIHCIIPGGGMAKDENSWFSSKENFFLPVKILSKVFRGKFLSAIEKLHAKGQLSFFGDLSHLKERSSFKQLLIDSCSHDWVVYSKPSFDGPKGVIQYLGRYTHRIAISNHRILNLTDDSVIFSYRDRKDGNIVKTMTLDVVAFMRRFLLHILPKAFTKIRYYGFLGNTVKLKKIQLVRLLLITAGAAAMPTPPVCSNWVELMIHITGKDPTLCPECKKGHLAKCTELPPSKAPPPACITA